MDPRFHPRQSVNGFDFIYGQTANSALPDTCVVIRKQTEGKYVALCTWNYANHRRVPATCGNPPANSTWIIRSIVPPPRLFKPNVLANSENRRFMDQISRPPRATNPLLGQRSKPNRAMSFNPSAPKYARSDVRQKADPDQVRQMPTSACSTVPTTMHGDASGYAWRCMAMPVAQLPRLAKM